MQKYHTHINQSNKTKYKGNCLLRFKSIMDEYVPGTNIMAGRNNITWAGTNIMTRNEYYRYLTFWPQRFIPGTNIMRQT